MTAKELFADWVEPDVSEYYLACLIGIMDLDTDRNDSFLKAKGVLNSRNRLSTALYHMLENMVERACWRRMNIPSLDGSTPLKAVGKAAPTASIR